MSEVFIGDEQPETEEEWIARLVASAPPLTDDQVALIKRMTRDAQITRRSHEDVDRGTS